MLAWDTSKKNLDPQKILIYFKIKWTSRINIDDFIFCRIKVKIQGLKHTHFIGPKIVILSVRYMKNKHFFYINQNQNLFILEK